MERQIGTSNPESIDNYHVQIKRLEKEGAGFAQIKLGGRSQPIFTSAKIYRRQPYRSESLKFLNLKLLNRRVKLVILFSIASSFMINQPVNSLS